MRIAWFSPVAPDQTDIANYTKRVIEPLKRQFQVEIFTSQSNPDIDQLGVPVRVIRRGQINWKQLNQFDYVIYNIGNNRIFHRDIWEISIRKPGIVVLHDESLQHFFAGIFKDANDKQSYLKYMDRFYGTKGRIVGKQFWDGLRSIDDLARKYPLTELALLNALGVIVHTKKLFEKIKSLNSYPVIHLDLPYTSQVNQRLKQIGSNKPYSLIVFGYIGTNRRLESILRALSSFPQKDLFRLTIIGDLWDENYIKKIVKELGLDLYVEILGYVDEEVLNRKLSEADLAFNLRYPTMGEASGSQLRIWDHELPSLVTNVGWYSSLPDDTVIKISIEKEIDDIHRCLEIFLEKPNFFKQIGKNGKKHLLENHSEVKYVNQLLSFLNQCKDYENLIYSYSYLSNRVFELSENFLDATKINLLTNIVKQVMEITYR